ncbi:hypothetical protein ACJMK2_044474 [Sinanodonta woodiana]|uniref:DNA helicase n=1 Tax=Sinanodonta woodiana TaxID=1069815 RepID=A0ABD3W053_SINWO
MSKVDISKLDFNIPLFGPLNTSASEGRSTTTSLPSTDYENDKNYNKYNSSKRKATIKTEDDGEEEDEDKSEESGSGSVDSSESGSDSDSDSSSDSSKSGSDSKSHSDSDEGVDVERRITRAKKDKMEDDDTSNLQIDTDSQMSSLDRSGRSRKSSTGVDREMWQEDPELYGLRRSGRQKKEPERYSAGQDSSSEDISPRVTRNRRNTSNDWEGSEESSSSSEEERFKPVRSFANQKARRRKPTGRAANVRRKVQRRKRLSSESEFSDSEEEDNRRGSSVRKAASKKVSYKEESEEATDSDDLIEQATGQEEEDSNKETIERILNHREGKVGATGGKTTIYNVEENGDPNVIGENDETEVQYLIKWKGWAHIHNTWENEATLREQKVNGLKKLDNYIRKNDELKEWKMQASPEDIEYFDCQQELTQDLCEQYSTVERVIAHNGYKTPNEQNGYPDYFCKWMGLPYFDCTWEDGELICKKFQSVIDEYHARNKSQRIPTKLSKVLKVRPKFAPMKNQPKFIGGPDYLQLRDYQLDGVNWLMHSWAKENSSILADEMGLGKTIQTIGFLSILYNTYQLYGPFLLVVPLSTVVAWQREFRIWAPEMNVVIYLGDINSRNMIREHEWCHPGNKRLKFNVIITTYEILLKDKSFLGSVSWSVLGVDEAHRLKNDDSLLYKTLFEFKSNHRLLITGTPLQNSLRELWALLHFIMPDKFDSWADFEVKHSSADKTGFSGLHKELEPYLLRRVKKDVEKSLPAKVEQILRVEMSSIQKQYYKWILTKNYRALSKGIKGSVSSFVNIVMELKKCCNHAYLVRFPEEENQQDKFQSLIRGSGKLLLLDKLLCRLRDTGHRVLIFSQMVRMLDILGEYMKYRHFPYQRLDGSIRGDIRKQALDHFNAEGSQDFCFLLSTRAGGLGVNLATADTVIIFDSDWNPQNDLQAQARAHRIGQKNQVSVYRLVTKNSVEEEIVERAKRKMVLDHLVIQRMDTTGRTVLNKGSVPSSNSTPFNKSELAAILKFGAEELFKDEDNEEEPQVDIDEILQRAETRDLEGASCVGDELLSQFKVVSFDNLEDEDMDTHEVHEDSGKDWDKIIPEVERKKVEEEEKQKELMELHLPPRSRKTIQQLEAEYDSDEKEHRKGKGDDEDEYSDDDSGDEKPRRRGRPRINKDNVKGFTDSELRRFIKSFKKFGAPMTRLDAIACDAELQEKSESDLRRVVDLLRSNCEHAMKEYQAKLAEDPHFDGKKTHRGPSFKLASVMVNAQSLVKAEAELEPLVATIPVDKEERKKFQLDCHVKAVHWDCLWDIEEDTNLLKGIYEYGMGSWEQMKMDPELNLHDKILPDGNLKPQAKHLQSRADYLLKVLKKNQEQSKSGVPQPKLRRRKKNYKSKAEVIEKGSDTDSSVKSIKEETNDSFPENSKKQKKKSEKEGKKEDKDEKEHDDKKDKKKEDKKKKKVSKKDGAGPMHFTANAEPVAISAEGDFEGELPKEVFVECKEKMRPVKRALKRLDNPEEGLSEKEQIIHTRQCLLKIGDRINEYLSDFNDPDKIKQWRCYLWIFVSKFTEFDAKKLHKLYKHAVKKREEEKEKEEEKSHSHKHDRNAGSHDKHADKSHKRLWADDSKKEQTVSKRPHSSEYISDRSLDNNSNSNGPWHFNQSSTSHSGTGHPTSFQNAFSNKASGSSQNDGNRWQHNSPLNRPTDQQQRNRYNDGGNNSYKRGGYSQQHEPLHRGFHGDIHHRFNDRRDQFHRERDHPGAGGGGSYQLHYRDRPDHRGDHHSDYGQFGYRDYGGTASHFRSEDSRSTDSNSYQGNPDRKRRGDGYFERERRFHKDPRLSDEYRNESHSPYTNVDGQSRH